MELSPSAQLGSRSNGKANKMKSCKPRYVQKMARVGLSQIGPLKRLQEQSFQDKKKENLTQAANTTFSS